MCTLTHGFGLLTLYIFSHFTWNQSQVERITKTIPHQGHTVLPCPRLNFLVIVFIPATFFHIPVNPSYSCPFSPCPQFLRPFFSTFRLFFFGRRRHFSDHHSSRWPHHQHSHPLIYTMVITVSWTVHWSPFAS